MLDNLRIIRKPTPAYEFISESSVILGFNSNVLLEALLCDKPIVAPYYDDILLDMQWDILSSHEDFVNYVLIMMI